MIIHGTGKKCEFTALILTIAGFRKWRRPRGWSGASRRVTPAAAREPSELLRSLSCARSPLRLSRRLPLPRAGVMMMCPVLLFAGVNLQPRKTFNRATTDQPPG